MRKWFLDNVPGNEKAFWDSHWDVTNIIEQLQDLFVDPNYKTIVKSFSRNNSLIEAGCGFGRFLIPLHELGYSIVGIDYSVRTIKRIKEFNPKYKVDVGNILSIEYPANSFDGYISLGVLEHLPEGIHTALIEANRVLKVNGKILVSVPYMNIIRRLKCSFPWMLSKKNRFFPGTSNKPKNFYAYVFNKREFINELRNANFEIFEVVPICIPFGVFLEFPFFEKSKITRSIIAFITLKIISNIPLLAWTFAHMIMLVAKKNEPAQR